MAEETNGNGKNGNKSAIAVGLAKHLGIPVGVIYAGLSWATGQMEEKNKEFKEVQTAIIELRESFQGQSIKIEYLEQQRETDKAQWGAMRRLDDKMERVEITSRANELILDKVLDDLIQPSNKVSSAKPNIIIKRAPAKATQSVDRYMDEQVQQIVDIISQNKN